MAALGEWPVQGTLDSTRVNFLCEITARHPSLLVWKHLERALHGRGDVDAAAPASDLDAIRADVNAIARETLAATHVIRCDHVADKSLHFFVQPSRLPQLFEFDICSQPSRGLAPWANPRHMLPLATMSSEGIRRLRPGAEAVVSLVYQGLSPAGTARLRGEDLRLVDRAFADDMVGAERACRTLPPRLATQPLLALVAQVSQGRWDRRLAQRAFVGFVMGCFAHPRFTARRFGFRLRLAVGQECVMSRLARRQGRRVPAPGLGALLHTARAEGHAVIEF
jgi:hypothetical protein